MATPNDAHPVIPGPDPKTARDPCPTVTPGPDSRAVISGADPRRSLHPRDAPRHSRKPAPAFPRSRPASRPPSAAVPEAFR